MNSYSFLDLKKVNEPYADEIKAAVGRVIDSGRYIGGDEVADFERNLAGLTRAPHCVGVSNGLDALRLILRAYIENGVMSPGDEVIVAANTYIASVLAITDAGLRPVLVEPDPATMNLDTSGLHGALTSRTKAVMPVHLYGRVCWDEAIIAFARDNGLKIIEDNAQAIGARAAIAGLYGSQVAGGLGDAGAFSFYPTKNVGAMGDAGAVVTHDPVLADTVRALANYGSDRRYHNIYCGFNCRLDPVQAAVLNVKLKHVDEENADRFARALVYHRTIDNPVVVKPLMSETVVDNVWHQYVVRIVGGHRDHFAAELSRRGVATDIHYAVPPHRQPCYSGCFDGYHLPLTEKIAGEVLSLPIARGTSLPDAAAISEIINSITIPGHGI